MQTVKLSFVQLLGRLLKPDELSRGPKLAKAT